MVNVALKPLEIDDGRIGARYRLLLSVAGQANDISAFPVTLHNLSTTGLLIQTATPISAGTAITLALSEHEDAAATIVWSDGAFHGAVFEKPLGRGVLTAITARSKVVWPKFNPPNPPAETRKNDALSADIIDFATAEIVGSHETQPVCIARSELPVSVRVQVILGIAATVWSVIIGGATLFWR